METETSKELSDNSGIENQNLENETQELETNATPEDYLGESGNVDSGFSTELNVDYKKRYADSTREAQRIKEEAEQAKNDLNELVTWMNEDPVTAQRAKDRLEGKTTVQNDPKVDTILQKVANLEKKISTNGKLKPLK